jgi:uncharacterized protein
MPTTTGGSQVLQMGASSGAWPDPVFRHADSSPAPLGIGLLMTPALRTLAERVLDAVDYVAVVPADFWPDIEPSCAERSTSIHAATRMLDAIAEDRPLVAHGVGGALGERCPPDARSLARILEWQVRYRFAWIGAQLLPQAAAPGHRAGEPAAEAPVGGRELRRIIDRVRDVQAALPVPLLLENGAWPLGPPVRDMTEATLLNRMGAATGCRLVLDLHSLSVNALDCGIDALAFLDRLELDRVVEVQLGFEPRRVSPGVPVPAVRQPPPIREMFDAILWRAPRLRAVTIDVTEADSRDVDATTVAPLLASVRRIWNLYR